jgi:hypothetical protein
MKITIARFCPPCFPSGSPLDTDANLSARLPTSDLIVGDGLSLTEIAAAVPLDTLYFEGVAPYTLRPQWLIRRRFLGHPMPDRVSLTQSGTQFEIGTASCDLSFLGFIHPIEVDLRENIIREQPDGTWKIQTFEEYLRAA